MVSAEKTLGCRIAVYGPAGSGKTTLARELGSRLGLPNVELDALYHLPGWGELPEAEFRVKVAEALDECPGGWVVDGNYSTVRDVVLSHADTAVWLRLPFRVVYPRLVRRSLRRAWTRELLWGTNRERWRDVLSRDSMLVWGITNWHAHHAIVGAALEALRADQQLVELRSPAEVQLLLEKAAHTALE